MNLDHSSLHPPYVILGMSGGVDSSVSALLLMQQGYRVEGLFMKNWETENEPQCLQVKHKSLIKTGCHADQDLVDARAVCLRLGIRLHTVNFSDDYWDRVFSYFLDEYRCGRTPNPDILCNKEIKFKAFLDYAIDLGADYIATGHFARKISIERNHQIIFHLQKAVDPNKDQTYFLYTLNQHQLSKTLFPIGNLTKAQIRQIAQEHHFRNYNKKGSTGICFIGERKFKPFLSQYLPAKPGAIETVQGQVIGKHEGLMYYTLGQRQGLNIGGIAGTPESPWYVLKKDLTRNVLMVGQGGDHPLLFSSQLLAHQLHWIDEPPSSFPFSCQAKIRYRQKEQPCLIEKIEDDHAKISFKNPERAVTPGQSIVFYHGDICLGGGIIA